MEIITEVKKINEIINDYKGTKANIWLFDISHIKLAMKIYSNEKEETLYLVLAGCKYIKGSFSLNNPDLFVSENFDDKTSEVIFKVTDNNSDFELTSSSGVALAKGIESEFGNSFENFLLSNNNESL
jgi:hypothetical protein